MQIETVVKSYPLTPLSANVNDLQPLTPGHFLVGGLLLKVSENNAILDSLLFSSRWTVVKRLKMLFWHCWIQEYLNKLQINSKWKKSLKNFQTFKFFLYLHCILFPLCSWRIPINYSWSFTH